MATSLNDLANSLSRDKAIARAAQSCDRRKLMAVKLADHSSAGAQITLTETGRWLLKSLETMTTFCGWELQSEQYDNRVTVRESNDELVFSIGRKDLEDRDPVAVLDAFTCAACGCDTSQVESHRGGFVQSENWNRARGVCEVCYPKRRVDVDGAIWRVDARNQRLGIHPQAILWQRGNHGVRLEKAMASVNYGININTGGGEKLDAQAMAVAMHDALSRYADKQAVEFLRGHMVVFAPDGTVRKATPADTHCAAIEYADREISKAITGQQVGARSWKCKDCQAEVMTGSSHYCPNLPNPTHEFRVGDRVKINISGALFGCAAKLRQRIGTCAWLLDVAFHGPYEYEEDHLRPLFSVGSRVACGHWTGTIIGPSAVAGQRWSINRDDTCEEYQRKDTDLEPLVICDSEKKFMPPCAWCGAVNPSHAPDTIIKPTCNDRGCRDLESLYRERLSAGGVDCPEEREAVRRFRSAQHPPLSAIFTVGDQRRIQDRVDRGEGVACLADIDQRIAAAQVEQKPRHPSDWSAWSTATSES